MLTFTEEQMVWADERASVHFYRRVRNYVREKLPKETRTIPNTKLLAYIGEQDRIAGEHGIKTELGVTKWVCLSLSYGGDFYQKEPAKKYFNAQNAPDAESKLHVLVEFLTARQNSPGLKMETVISKHGYHKIGG